MTERITDPQERKRRPVVSGVLDYFPDAILAIAELSLIGNDQHNPGKPLHWDRSKSGDEADAMVRHLMERGTLDTDGVRHSAKVAWRALALLQKEIEDAAPKAKPERSVVMTEAGMFAVEEYIRLGGTPEGARFGAVPPGFRYREPLAVDRVDPLIGDLPTAYDRPARGPDCDETLLRIEEAERRRSEQPRPGSPGV